MASPDSAAALIALNADEPLANGNAWIHLLPAGRFTGIDGRGPYDATDAEGIVLASRDHSGQRQMVIDYNHATDLSAKQGGDSPAAGWIVGMQARPDGIWGLAEWTPKAAAHLADREYRYLSPVFQHDSKGRIGRILRASLTNSPNLDQLTALASAEDTAMDDLLTKLRKLLGLGPEASEEAIIAAVTDKLTATQSAEPDPTQYVPIGQFQRAVAEGNKLRQGISLQAAEERVGQVIDKGIILPWMREWAVSLCMSNVPSFESFVMGCGPGFSRLLKATNASGVLPTSQGGNDPMSAEVARNMGLDPTKFAEFQASQG